MNLGHIFKGAFILILSAQLAKAQEASTPKPTPIPRPPTCSELHKNCQRMSLSLDQHLNDADYINQGIRICSQGLQTCTEEENKLRESVSVHRLNFINAARKIK